MGLPARMFFDLAVIHLLTTATIDRLRALYPAGRSHGLSDQCPASTSRPQPAPSRTTTEVREETTRDHKGALRSTGECHEVAPPRARLLPAPRTDEHAGC